jgi:hypothetical protein
MAFFSLSFSLLSSSLPILPEGVVVGIQIFAWAPNFLNKNSGKKIFRFCYSFL